MWRDYMGEGDRRSFAYQIQSARCETRRVRSKTVVRPKADYVRRSAAKLGYLDQAGFAEDMPRLTAGDYQSPGRSALAVSETSQDRRRSHSETAVVA